MKGGYDEATLYPRFSLCWPLTPLHYIPQKATNQGHLHKLWGRSPTIRITSLYADDAAIFVKPIKEDITFWPLH
jgi:hypothetical protein